MTIMQCFKAIRTIIVLNVPTKLAKNFKAKNKRKLLIKDG